MNRHNNSNIIIGNRVGYITVIEVFKTDSQGRKYYKCLCDCGKFCFPRKDALNRNSSSQSCGCKTGKNNELRAKEEKAKSRARYIKNRENVCANSRAYKLKSNYGITPEEYNKMLVDQNERCAICDRDKTQLPEAQQKLYVDHCHKTGKVRKLLCYGCNSAIGFFKENIESLKSAINYLIRFEPQQ